MSTPVIGLTTYNSNNTYGHPIAALAHKYIPATDRSRWDAGSDPFRVDRRRLNPFWSDWMGFS